MWNVPSLRWRCWMSTVADSWPHMNVMCICDYRLSVLYKGIMRTPISCLIHVSDHFRWDPDSVHPTRDHDMAPCLAPQTINKQCPQEVGKFPFLFSCIAYLTILAIYGAKITKDQTPLACFPWLFYNQTVFKNMNIQIKKKTMVWLENSQAKRTRG